jgi:hypothetical protein
MVNGRYFYFFPAFIFLLIGGFIYICFRDENILFLFWLRNININYSLFRQTNSVNNIVTSFIVYNLPNGLWALSGLLFLKTFLSDKKLLTIYSIIFITICLLHEISQYFEIIPGTFDIFDIISITIFSSIGLSINTLWRRHENT